MSYVRHKLSRTYDLLCRTYDLNACMVSIQSPCVQRGHEASAKHSSILAVAFSTRVIQLPHIQHQVRACYYLVRTTYYVVRTT